MNYQLKKYSKYKPSGVEWIGEIPEEWDYLKIKRLTNVKRGASPRPIEDPKYFDNEGEFAWVRIADVTASERYLEQTTQQLSDLGASLSVKRYPGDFFLSIAGTVGKPIITKIKCCIHDGFVWFPKLQMNPEYLYYIFCTGLPYQGLGKWGTQLNLNTETVGEIIIPLPQEEEINHIISYLDDKTAKIDSLIEKKKKLIELYKEERTAVINHYVLGQHLLIDNGQNSIDNGQLTMDNYQLSINNYQLPKGWEVKKLKYVLRIKSGDGIKSEEIDFEGTFPVYGGNGVMGYTEKYNSDKLDIIIGRVGAKCGNVRLVDGKKWISDNALVAELLEGYDYKFISIVLESINLNSLANQNAQPLITGTLVRDKVVSLPLQITEQHQIVQHIETETKRIDDTISKIEKEIELLAEYRTALISEVVTGKIKV